MTAPDPKQPEQSSSAEQPTAMASSGSSGGPGDISVNGLISAAHQYVGRQLGEYTLLELIGAGGGGAVFRARHDRMDRLVALKVISPQSMRDTETVRRFEREVRAAAKLMHPNIVTAFDAGEQGDIHYLVMELVDGLPLSKVVERQGPLPIETALRYVLQVARALRYAHQRNIIHRDIKPSNILLDSDDNTKVLDMGLARLHRPAPAKSDEHLTQVGVVLGTIGYISPEQAMSAVNVDHRTDIYSLGCTLYFLLTGRTVYTGNFMQALMAHLSEPIPALSARCPDASPLLEAAFTKMVAKKPESRQASMDEVIAELELCLRERTSGPHSARSSAESRLDRLLRDTVQGQERLSTFIHPAITVALDVGTSNASAAAVDLEHRLVTIPSIQRQAATPSLVSYEKDRFAVGTLAAQNFSAWAHCTATEIRRALGDNEYPRALGGQMFPPEVLLACLYRHLLDNARDRVGEARWAVLTVPACFDDLRRRAVQCGARLAGVESMGLLNETSAAALLWAFRKQLSPDERRRVLVYRLGGGSFDASLFEIQGRRVTMLSSYGDDRLGGVDWDQRLAEAVAQQFQREQQLRGINNPVTRLQLQHVCEQAKRTLSDFDRAPIRATLSGHAVQGVVSREWFANLTGDLLERTQVLAQQAISAAGLAWESLDHVLPVGGMTRLPRVKQLLEHLAPQRVESLGWGDDAIARGAALYSAQALHRGPDQHANPWEVTNVTTQDLATVGMDHHGQKRVGVIVRRGTRLPIYHRRTFRTRRPGQTTLVAQLVQGDAENAESCTLIATYVIHLPADLPAQSAVDLEFTLTSEGLVEVAAEVASRQFPVTLEVTRPNGMTAEDLEVWHGWLETLFLCDERNEEGSGI